MRQQIPGVHCFVQQGGSLHGSSQQRSFAHRFLGISFASMVVLPPVTAVTDSSAEESEEAVEAAVTESEALPL